MIIPGPDEIHLAFVKVEGCTMTSMLGSPAALTTFLAMLTEALDMTVLGTLTVQIHGDEPHLNDPGGCTGVNVLSTSHAAAHTWPERLAVNVLVYSCKPFDPKLVAEYAASFFGGVAYYADITPEFRRLDAAR